MELKRQHRWQHRDTGRIDRRNVLIVGAGSIGRATARLCSAAGMAVDGLARRPRTDDPDFRRVYASDDLHDALPHADYVAVTAPLTPATRGLFDDKAFAAMKPGTFFINVGRGPIVKTDALLHALQSQHLAGAAVDVFEEEPLPPDHPLWDQDNVIITAHMAGDFIGWREALSAQFLENFRRWLDGEALMNLVHKEKVYGMQ
jgi:phosphoglycerate dehydrogenase-like enzyme